ncbi:MAG: Hsp20 family protein [Candidatus Methanoperedens sp.]|nr:Hsp20 family protein [Candidatus Methanoperedens sp.]
MKTKRKRKDEHEKNIHAVIALPGMENENIKLTCSGRSLEITANNAEKTVTEAIELPVRVNKTGMSATYKNGILEVIFNKRKVRKSIR